MKTNMLKYISHLGFIIIVTLALNVSAESSANGVVYKVIREDAGRLQDCSRAEANMRLLGLDINSYPKALPTGCRSLAVQIYLPAPSSLVSSAKKMPVIIFSGGFAEDYRLYSTILNNLSASGYIIINIDHYYHQNTAPHTKEFDEDITKIKASLSSEKAGKEKRFNKAKLVALDIYTGDILFVLKHLPELLKNYQYADLGNIALMGHSLGGNAGKNILDQLTSDESVKNIKVLVSLDSRLNQLGLSTEFRVPTLVVGAEKAYQTPDPLRQLPSQPNLTLIIMDKATHISFDDVAIFTILGKNLDILNLGLNDSAKQELAQNIAEISQGKKIRFGEELFMGSKEDMNNFLLKLNTEIDRFLSRYLQ